ncbi:alpha/beta hydrolase [Micromonospora sp. NPDC050200]|uniref:alpha/beta hydrolase n=1 Tax=Micromonospora sp. NPDC050200 TaxID=3155664 RepID=UPI0033D5E096
MELCSGMFAPASASRAASPIPNRVARIVAAVVAAAAVAVAADPAAATGPRTAQLSATHCSTHVVPVRTADPGPYDQLVWGELCYRGEDPPETVQLLVHGASYSHLYWDSPVQNNQYSYVRAATLAGYATFNVDALGVGNSSVPPSSVLTITAEAVALHDVITALRSGKAGPAFRHVIWVGHSLGSMDGIAVAARYRDIDALVVTGLLHGQSAEQSAALAAQVYPATDDPKFAASGLDSGYQTFRPGGRAQLFYDPSTADPEILQMDEQTKDVMAFTTKLAEAAALLFPIRPEDGLTHEVNVPVLVVAGQRDAMFCGADWIDCNSATAVRNYEAEYYGPDAHLQAVVIPATGHCLTLSTTAPLTYAAMLAWTYSAVRP